MATELRMETRAKRCILESMACGHYLKPWEWKKLPRAGWGWGYREEALSPGELGVLVFTQKRQRKENKLMEGIWRAKEENVWRRGVYCIRCHWEIKWGESRLGLAAWRWLGGLTKRNFRNTEETKSRLQCVEEWAGGDKVEVGVQTMPLGSSAVGTETRAKLERDV